MTDTLGAKTATQWPGRILQAGAVGFAAIGLITTLGFWWTQGRRPLGNDSFSYLEYSKRFVDQFPDRFGDWWPYGYPVLGALLSKFGLSAYHALQTISILSIAVVVASAWLILNPGKQRRHEVAAVLAAGCCAPGTILTLAGPMSEPLFLALLFGLAISLGGWPSPRAIVASMALMVCVFCVRYVGAFSFGLVLVYLFLYRQPLRAVGLWRMATQSYLFCTLLAAGLCLTNYLAFGRITGPHPVGQESPFTWPVHLADFGWGLVGLFTSGAGAAVMRLVGGSGSPGALLIGWAIVLAISVLLVFAWRSARSEFLRPMVLLVVSYALTMVTFRSVVPFDALSSPRSVLPVLFPLCFVTLCTAQQMWRSVLVVISVALFVVAVVLAGRGMSPAVNPDISELGEQLRVRVRPGDTVAVNAHAIHLAAWFPNAFVPTNVSVGGGDVAGKSTHPWSLGSSTFSVIAFPVEPKSVRDTVMSAWNPLISEAINSGTVSVVHQSRDGVILRIAATEPYPQHRNR